jgi:hypothetical protein
MNGVGTGQREVAVAADEMVDCIEMAATHCAKFYCIIIGCTRRISRVLKGTWRRGVRIR